MDAQQTPAQQIVRLGRSRSLLARSGTDRREVNRLLAPFLSDFERARLEFKGISEIPSRRSFLAALKPVLAAAEEGEALDLAMIRAIHAELAPDCPPGWRSATVSTLCPNHQPLSAALVPRALDRFLEWVASPGFLELHPVEQMTLCQVRLLEISPLPRYSEAAVSIVTAYWPVRGGLLLPFFAPAEAPRFWDKLADAFAFSTEGLVEFNLQGCQAAFDEVQRIGLG